MVIGPDDGVGKVLRIVVNNLLEKDVSMVEIPYFVIPRCRAPWRWVLGQSARSGTMSCRPGCPLEYWKWLLCCGSSTWYGLSPMCPSGSREYEHPADHCTRQNRRQKSLSRCSIIFASLGFFR